MDFVKDHVFNTDDEDKGVLVNKPQFKNMYPNTVLQIKYKNDKCGVRGLKYNDMQTCLLVKQTPLNLRVTFVADNEEPNIVDISIDNVVKGYIEVKTVRFI